MSLQIIHPVHQATHRIGLYLEKLGQSGLTQAEAHILASLADFGKATVAELHHSLAHKRSTLTSILDRLTSKKLVRREVDENDRRSFIISLTTSGRRLAQRIKQHLLSLEAAVDRRVRPSDIKVFRKVLAVLAEEAQRETKRSKRSTR
jgi:DNA-binding MarR family transcriptional regulator